MDNSTKSNSITLNNTNNFKKSNISKDDKKDNYIYNNKSIFEIPLNSDKISKLDIKKIFEAKGIHIYNINEKSNWTSGNKDTKLNFNIRNNDVDSNDNNSNIKINEAVLDLQKKGLDLNEVDYDNNAEAAGYGIDAIRTTTEADKNVVCTK